MQGASAAGPSPRRIYLIAGSGGMLGTALKRALTEKGAEYLAPTEREFDITSVSDIGRQLESLSQRCDQAGKGARGVLLNAAAYTNVERAEDEPDVAERVNAVAPGLLAAACREAGVSLVHVSTDFVFDGRKTGPYREDDTTNPLSVYGATKLAGERAVLGELPDALVVRTAWVFGPGGANFPVKILAAARERDSLTVVTDEIGSPTYTLHLAEGILGLLDRDADGLFHLAGAGSCSRFELAKETLRLVGLEGVSVEAALSDAFPTKAERPRNSVLDCGKAEALGVSMPGWRDGLHAFLADAGELRA